MNTMQRNPGQPLDDGRHAADGGRRRVEFTTTIRGRRVTAWLDGGCLGGDPELLRRLERVIGVDDELDPITLVHLIGEAVGSEVVLHLGAPTDDASRSS